MPTVDQVRGIAERLFTVLGVWLVAKGYIGTDDVAQFAPVLIAALTAWYAYYKNRPKSLVQRAAALPNTSVVTAPEIANDTPEPNIVSATTNSVVPKTDRRKSARP